MCRTRKTLVAKKHVALMLLCCLIPMGIVLGMLAFGVTLSTTLLVAMVLLCPLLHILMMGLMHGSTKHSASSGPMIGDRADCHPAPQRHPPEEARS